MNRVTHTYLLVSFILTSLLLGLYSCSNSQVSDQWIDIAGFEWPQDSTYHFVFDITDTAAYYNVDLGLRHLNHYPYQNIWLLSGLQGLDSVAFSDTIQCQIADKYGVWYGKRSASIYTYTERMYTGVKFSTPGQYKLTLQHGMRKNNLVGISGVGIKIEKNN